MRSNADGGKDSYNLHTMQSLSYVNGCFFWILNICEAGSQQNFFMWILLKYHMNVYMSVIKEKWQKGTK